MRKLLVVSQKCGVGKTTTSINLAAATALSGSPVLLLDADPLSGISAALNLPRRSDRLPLREAGLDLPGVLCRAVIPGLDILSPYEDSACTEEKFDKLIELFQSPEFQSCYGCLIVDAPPFLGTNPGQLLAPCDELILVIRAEAMADRTLPAFLELVQRSKKSSPIKLKGMVLTLSQGEVPGGRCERELRGRFGTRILPQVVPHDEEVAKDLLVGQIATHASPDSPAALAYTILAAALNLAVDAATVTRHEKAGLLVAAARRRAAAEGGSAAPMVAMAPAATVDAPQPLPTPQLPIIPEPARANYRPRFIAPSTGQEVEVVPQAHIPLPETPLAPSPVAAAPTAQPQQSAWHIPGTVWIGIGIVLGVGLRFVELPATMLPITVGVAVALATVLILRFSLLPSEQPQAPPLDRPPSKNGHSGEHRKLTKRKEPPRQGYARLAALARRLGVANLKSKDE